MALLLNGTDQRLVASWPTAAYPFSLHGWMRVDDWSVNSVPISLGDSSSGSYYAAVRADDGTSEFDPGPINALIRNGGTTFCQSTSRWAYEDWTHFMGVFVSATERYILVDGVQENTSTTSLALVADQIAIGSMADATPGDFFAGALAFLACHTGDMRSYAADLAAGSILPDEVDDATNTLIAYAPLVDSLSVQGPLSWTAENLASPTYVDGPDGIGGNNPAATIDVVAAAYIEDPDPYGIASPDDVVAEAYIEDAAAINLAGADDVLALSYVGREIPGTAMQQRQIGSTDGVYSTLPTPRRKIYQHPTLPNWMWAIFQSWDDEPDIFYTDDYGETWHRT